MKQTYKLNWEIVQEFSLPPDHCCCSVDVNDVLGEIMFACKRNGLLHYKWSSHSGLVLATDQPYRVTQFSHNSRLVSCSSDGSYLVLNHRQLCCIRLASNRSNAYMQTAQLDATGASSTIRTGSLYTTDSFTAFSRQAAVDCIEYLDQTVGVGDVRSMAVDKQTDSVFLLYPDRMVRHSLSNLADSCIFDRCYSLTAELFNVRLSRQFVYLMNSLGDIMLRYRSECHDKRDHLSWRTIGCRAFASPSVVEQQAQINRKLCINSDNYLQLLDSESPVGSLGLAVDSCRQLVFASTGGPCLYALWHPELEPDTSAAGWGKNWLSDIRIPLTNGHKSDDFHRGGSHAEEAGHDDDAGSDGGDDRGSCGGGAPDCDASMTAASEEDIDSGAFVPGPLACSSSNINRSAFLYAVDATAGNKVTVLKYFTETAPIE